MEETMAAGLEVLASASAYKKKYYFNETFAKLPEPVKQELKIMCVLFTEDVGGVILLGFDETGSLVIRTDAYEEDILYDEIGSALLAKKLSEDKQELFTSLEAYYEAFHKQA